MKEWIAVGAAVVMALGTAAIVHAADHTDSPAARANQDADLTDLYAWMDPSSGQLNLVLNYFPDAPQDALASDAVLYAFHLESMQEFGAEDRVEMTIICGFDADQNVECWAGDDEYVSGDANDPSGRESDSGQIRVFTGVRNDPFFFNITGFQETTNVVKSVAGDLAFDEAGCPLLDEETSQTLVTQLQSEADGTEARDDFAGQNVRVFAMQIDADLVTAGGPIISVWASTHQR